MAPLRFVSLAIAAAVLGTDALRRGEKVDMNMTSACLDACIDKKACVVKSTCPSNCKCSAGFNRWNWCQSNCFGFNQLHGVEGKPIKQVSQAVESAGESSPIFIAEGDEVDEHVDMNMTSTCLDACIDKQVCVVKSTCPSNCKCSAGFNRWNWCQSNCFGFSQVHEVEATPIKPVESSTQFIAEAEKADEKVDMNATSKACLDACIDKKACVVKSTCPSKCKCSAGFNRWNWCNSNCFGFSQVHEVEAKPIKPVERSTQFIAEAEKADEKLDMNATSKACLDACIDKKACVVKSTCPSNCKCSAGFNRWNWCNSNCFGFSQVHEVEAKPIKTVESSTQFIAEAEKADEKVDMNATSKACLDACIDKKACVVKSTCPSNCKCAAGFNRWNWCNSNCFGFSQVHKVDAPHAPGSVSLLESEAVVTDALSLELPPPKL